jgi:hypothetical protein
MVQLAKRAASILQPAAGLQASCSLYAHQANGWARTSALGLPSLGSGTVRSRTVTVLACNRVHRHKQHALASTWGFACVHGVQG